MLTLPPSVKIYISAQPVDARRSIGTLHSSKQSSDSSRSAAICSCSSIVGNTSHSCFSGTEAAFVFLRKRLEAGTFRLAREVDAGAMHVEINSAELALMLEGIEPLGAKHRKRYQHHPA